MKESLKCKKNNHLFSLNVVTTGHEMLSVKYSAEANTSKSNKEVCALHTLYVIFPNI